MSRGQQPRKDRDDFKKLVRDLANSGVSRQTRPTCPECKAESLSKFPASEDAGDSR